MANKLPVLDEGQKGLNEMIRLLKEVQAEIVKTSQLMRETPKNTFDLKTPKEANAILQKRVQISEQTAAALKEQDRLERNLISQIEKNKTATESTNRALIKHRYETQQVNRAIKEETILNSRLSTEYQKLVVRMNQTGRTVQSLTAKKEQGLVLSKKEQDQLRKSQAQFSRYNKAVIAADASINRFQRNVGNYGSALKGLAGTFRSLVGALGVTSGIYLFVGILRSGLQTLRDFGASMANLAGIFRVTREDLAPLEADIIAVAGASIKTATEVAKLAEALATLGKSKEEISDLLEPVNNLSIGLGATSEETAEFLVQTINAFGGSTKEALKYADTIATIRTSTSLNFQRMRDSFQYLTPISQILNKDLAYTGALIGIVADSGIKAERAGRLLGTAQQKLAKEGSTLAQALEEVNEASARGIKEEKLLAIASNLFGKQAASLGIILAQNSDIIETNAQAIRDNGGALDDLVNEQLKSLDASLLILRSRWEQYILNTDDATGSSGKLIKIINFLGDNLSKIIDTIITVVKTFVAYKLILIAVGAAQKIATGFTIAYRIALIAMNRGVLSAIRSLGFLRAALIKTRIGAAIVIVGALVVAFKNMNKSIGETAKKLNDLSKEFITQNKETQKVNDELNTMVSRYDELKGKTNLNAKEQKELNTIIETIGKTVPDAVTEIDKYGKALEINTGKVKEFTERNKEASLQLANTLIADQSKVLKTLERDLSNYDKALGKNATGINKTNGLYIEGIGTVEKLNNKFTVRNKVLRTNTALTTDQNQKLLEYVNGIESSIVSTKNSIKANQDVINSVSGVTAAQEKQNKIDAAAEDAAVEKILIVRQLKKELSDLQEKLKGLTKNGYNNLTKAQADTIVSTRSLIAEKKKELDAITGVTNANSKKVKGLEALEGSVGFYEKYITQLKKEQSALATTSEQYNDYAKSIQRVQDAINAIKDADGISDALELAQLYDHPKKLGEEIAQQLTEGINSGLDRLSSTTGIGVQELFEEFNDLYEWDYLNFLKFSKKKIEQSGLEEGKKREALIEGLEIAGRYIDEISNLTSVFYDRKIQKYDDDIQKNNDYYAVLLDNENLSEEQRSALEAERERKNAELEKKKRAEQRKQAKLNKAFAALNIIVETSVAIVKSIAASPLTGGLPFSAIAASLGAIQLAAVLAQPIPKYKHGRSGGDAEFAYVGDGGVSEIIARAGGGYEITPNRETLTYLNKGDSVLPDASKFLQEQAYNMSLSAQGRSIERIQVNNGLTKVDIDRQTQSLIKAMSQNKTSVRVHNNNTIGADLKFLNRLNDVL